MSRCVIVYVYFHIFASRGVTRFHTCQSLCGVCAQTLGHWNGLSSLSCASLSGVFIGHACMWDKWINNCVYVYCMCVCEGDTGLYNYMDYMNMEITSACNKAVWGYKTEKVLCMQACLDGNFSLEWHADRAKPPDFLISKSFFVDISLPYPPDHTTTKQMPLWCK